MIKKVTTQSLLYDAKAERANLLERIANVTTKQSVNRITEQLHEVELLIFAYETAIKLDKEARKR